MRDLTILTEAEYQELKQELKAADLSLSYTATSARPVYMRWSDARKDDKRFLEQVIKRRPASPGYHLACVRVDRPGNWLRRDRLSITFHAVSSAQDADLKHYLAAHPIARRDVGETPHEIAEGHDRATSLTYVRIALMLAVITAVEVALMYLPDGLRPSRSTLLVLLLFLSILKFGLVASYFMHLRYDHRLYAGFFMAGLVIAAGTAFALLALFYEAPGEALAATEQGETVTAMQTELRPQRNTATGHDEALPGVRVFQQYGCGACHTVGQITAARGTIGPPLDGLVERSQKRIPGLSSDAYIRQSVEMPNAFVVKGYLKLMPSLRENMSDREFSDLLIFLRTL